jgi:hypothetical protein
MITMNKQELLNEKQLIRLAQIQGFDDFEDNELQFLNYLLTCMEDIEPYADELNLSVGEFISQITTIWNNAIPRDILNNYLDIELQE